MIAMLREWWTKLLNAIGLYTRLQYTKLEGENIGLCSDFDQMSETYRTELKQLRSDSEKAQREQDDKIKKLEDDLAAAKQDVIKAKRDAEQQLQYDIAKYKAVPNENAELIKELQKQLGDLFRDSPVFGFPNSMPIPGSTCIVSHEGMSSDGSKAVCQGRCILTDDMTIVIDQHPSAEDRVNIITNYMQRYDILSRIARELLRHGAIGLSLAYNKKCTAYEVYYEVVADIVKGAALTINTDERVPEDR